MQCPHVQRLIHRLQSVTAAKDESTNHLEVNTYVTKFFFDLHVI